VKQTIDEMVRAVSLQHEMSSAPEEDPVHSTHFYHHH